MKNLVLTFILAAALGLADGCSTPAPQAPAKAPTKKTVETVLAPGPAYLQLQGLALQLAGVTPNPSTVSQAEAWAFGSLHTGGAGDYAQLRAEVRGRWDWSIELLGPAGGYNHQTVR